MKKVILLLLVFSMFLSFCGLVLAQETPQKWALLIGISEYAESARLEPMPYAIKDCEAIKGMFKDSWGVPEGNIITLYNEEATYDNIKSTLAELEAKVGEDDYLFVYYSGRGEFNFPDFNGDEPGGSDECIVPYDCEANFPRTYVTDDKFTKWLQKVKGNFVFIMDFDGGYGMMDFGTNSSLEDRTAILSVYGLAREISAGDPGIEHAVMTYNLIKANNEMIEEYRDDNDLGDLTLQVVIDKLTEDLDEILKDKKAGNFAVSGKLDTTKFIILKK